LLSSAREEANRKEREEALSRDEAQVAEIKAAQSRTRRVQRRSYGILSVLVVAILGGWLAFICFGEK